MEKYGQGGPCSKTDEGLCYHNSFLIADASKAWILETSGKHWAAVEVNSKNFKIFYIFCSLICVCISSFKEITVRQFTGGYRNISNALTITTKLDRKSEGLEEYAKSKGLWDGQVLTKLIIIILQT